MEKIDIRNITDITVNKITFRNDHGDVSFIELEACANSYDKAHNIKNRDIAGYRCVGERFFGEYAYYEFYTAEHTQFYLELKTGIIKKLMAKVLGWNFHAKDFAMFYSIQKKLNAHGWTTMDLS